MGSGVDPVCGPVFALPRRNRAQNPPSFASSSHPGPPGKVFGNESGEVPFCYFRCPLVNYPTLSSLLPAPRGPVQEMWEQGERRAGGLARRPWTEGSAALGVPGPAGEGPGRGWEALEVEVEAVDAGVKSAVAAVAPAAAEVRSKAVGSRRSV